MPICNRAANVSISWNLRLSTIPTAFLEVMAEEIPITKSLTGLRLIDGIRDFVKYDYKKMWKSLSKDERVIRLAAYRQIRQVYIRIERFITGDLSQQNVAEATARIACAHLNLFLDSKQHVDFERITVSGFNRKWTMFATNQLPTFPEMVIQSKESHLDQCLVSSTLSAVISDGTYTFRNLLRKIQSLHFDFQIKATGSSCLQLHPSVLLRTDSIMSVNTGTTTNEGDMIRIVGDIDQSVTLENEMLLSIPASEFCVYELVHASLILSISEKLDEYCQIGHQLDINWEKSVAVDFLSTETQVEDLELEFHEIPKSLAGISLVDGIWNYVAWNYEAM